MDLNNQAVIWGAEYLSSNGYHLRSAAPEEVVKTPWSWVNRYSTKQGYVYLKQMPPLLAIESTITQLLKNKFQALVPEIISHNNALNCFLMKDAGQSMRQMLKQDFDVALLGRGVEQFTSLQIDVADRVDLFTEIGVPDWRLDKFLDLYKHLILQTDVLMADGLSEAEIDKLQNLLPVISDLCEELSTYSVKESLVQPDFSDNNLLVGLNGDITMIDMGEIVISHPFFSLINCLKQVKKHYGITENDRDYQSVVDACLKNYLTQETQVRLFDIYEKTQILWFVYIALANIRLMKATGRDDLLAFQPGKLANVLRDLIAVCDINFI